MFVRAVTEPVVSDLNISVTVKILCTLFHHCVEDVKRPCAVLYPLIRVFHSEVVHNILIEEHRESVAYRHIADIAVHDVKAVIYRERLSRPAVPPRLVEIAPCQVLFPVKQIPLVGISHDRTPVRHEQIMCILSREEYVHCVRLHIAVG